MLRLDTKKGWQVVYMQMQRVQHIGMIPLGNLEFLIFGGQDRRSYQPTNLTFIVNMADFA
jgi:hypothetical protein